MLTRSFGHRLVKSLFIVVALLLALAGPAQAYFVPSTHQAATLVLGQPNFTSNTATTTQSGMNYPAAIAVDPATHKVFVADADNNRVLRFASFYALTNGAAAQAVLGQPNFTGSAAATTQNGMAYPYGVAVDAGGRLWVADKYNHRVLRFDNAASKASGANADGVLGQADFIHATYATTQSGMDFPMQVFADAGGRLWVGDTSNNRILRFDNAAAKANGANADGVLGQPDFTNNTPATTQNGISDARGLFVDASGRLWVGDSDNNRVLRFDAAAAKANGAYADGVLGQPNFTSGGAHVTQNGMNLPYSVALDNATGRLYVADYDNNRILVFNAATGLANGANASFVLGQTNFTTNTQNSGGISAATLYAPYGLFYDQIAKVLWAADYFNQRVLLYGKPSSYFQSSSTAASDGWLHESTETSGVGSSFSTSGVLVLGDDAANRQFRSLVSFDTSGLPDNAVIRAVTLKIKKSGVVGADPLATFGFLLADIRKGSFGVPALQVTDFQASATAYAIGHFTAISAQPGWYQLVVPATDYADLNLAGVTQFRLRFTLDDNNNHVANYDTFFAGDAVAGTNRPVLNVEYTVP